MTLVAVEAGVTGQLTKVICCHSSHPEKNFLPMIAIREED